MPNERKTATGTIFVDEQSIVHAVNTVKREHTIEDARENMTVVEQVSGGIRRPMLVDMTIPAKQTAECQRYYASDEVAAIVTAVGLLTPSMLSKVLGNIVIGLSSASVPMKLFNAKPEAIAWLMAFRPA
ncbi:MAG: hypothetical protein WCJ30_04180 [Deltaproteobacteria bacterium]